MTETPKPSIYESTFAKSDKTDAILVVGGKKLHVNKALLSYHSDFFNVLFNSDFKEKTMEEIPIEDVDFEHFATVLSLVHSDPIKLKNDLKEIESLLQIADRFQLPAVKRHLEMFLFTTTIELKTHITIADKYQLDALMDRLLSVYTTKSFFLEKNGGDKGPKMKIFNKLSKTTKVKIFHRILEIDQKISVDPKVEDPLLFFKVVAESDKTDGILVVEGEKMHVNKAVLSYHSEYFNALFNANFVEKPMDEIEIKDVGFKDFATLLSFIQLNAIMPTGRNVENILELADRFAISCVKFHLEPLVIHFCLEAFDDIRIGNKYGMTDLIKNGVSYLDDNDYNDLTSKTFYEGLSDETKIELLYKYMTL